MFGRQNLVLSIVLNFDGDILQASRPRAHLSRYVIRNMILRSYILNLVLKLVPFHDTILCILYTKFSIGAAGRTTAVREQVRADGGSNTPAAFILFLSRNNL